MFMQVLYELQSMYWKEISNLGFDYYLLIGKISSNFLMHLQWVVNKNWKNIWMVWVNQYL